MTVWITPSDPNLGDQGSACGPRERHADPNHPLPSLLKCPKRIIPKDARGRCGGLRGALDRSCLNSPIFLKLAQYVQNVITNRSSSQTFFEIFSISGDILHFRQKMTIFDVFQLW